jgi:hypothetical protein
MRSRERIARGCRLQFNIRAWVEGNEPHQLSMGSVSDGLGAGHRDIANPDIRVIPGWRKAPNIERCTLRRSRPPAESAPLCRLGNVCRRTPFSLWRRDVSRARGSHEKENWRIRARYGPGVWRGKWRMGTERRGGRSRRRCCRNGRRGKFHGQFCWRRARFTQRAELEFAEPEFRTSIE